MTMQMTAQVYKEQVYECLGSEPYVNRKGRTVELVTWQSRCLECGEVFTFRHQARGKFSPNRRCDAHKKHGKRMEPVTS
jgi:hypothetical protein